MKFSDIPGHIKTKERLIRSVAENRVSHAQLFFGPEGSGKLALALAYAQYINCRHRGPLDSCGECPSCKKYARLVHPDLHFIFPVNKTKEVDEKKVYSRDFLVYWREFLAGTGVYASLPEWYEKIGIEKKQGFISADDADSINTTLAYKAYEAEYKVMVIWMVEKMNVQAMNKVLKNLEEPPDKTLFLLITEDYNQLLKTITSRAQLIKIPRPEDREIAEFLAENRNIEREEAQRITFLADGNLGRAIALSSTEPGASQELSDRFLLFREWMRNCFTIKSQLKDYEKLQGTIQKLVGEGSREKQKEFLGYSLEMLSSCLQYHVGNHSLARYEGEELKFVTDFSPFVNPGNITALEEEFNLAVLHIERNANALFVFTDLSHILAKLLRRPAAA